MARKRKEPERWWNVRVEIVMPFDTEEEARAFIDADAWADEFGEVAHKLMGGCREVMNAGIEEAVEGVWPY